MRWWLRVGRLFDGTGSAPRHDVAVGLTDGIVSEIVPGDQTPPGEPVRELPGATLTPGFVDAHVHLLFSCDVDHARTRRRFEVADDATLTAIGVRNAAESLLGGVTTVRDCGDTRGIVGAIRAAGRDGWVSGPRILTAGAPLTTPTGHLNWCGNTVETDAEVVAAVHRLADAGADLLKIMTSGGNMTTESDPLAAQFSDHQVALAARTAHDRGLHVAAHAQNVASITGAVQGGVDTIEHCLWRETDGTPSDQTALVDLLQGSGATVVLTLAGIQRALLPGATGYGEVERAGAAAVSRTGSLEGDFAWARHLHDTGVPVVVASDAGVRFTPFRGFLDSIRCAQIALQCTASEAIAASTSRAAAAIGLGSLVGTVAPGYRADLTLLTGGDDDSLGTVSEVLVDGRTVVRDGALVLEALTPSAH